MENDQRDKGRQRYLLTRSIMDYGMGLIILGCGVFFAIAPELGIEFNIVPLFRYFFSVMCIVYGGWRIYRGYKKNYFTDSERES